MEKALSKLFGLFLAVYGVACLVCGRPVFASPVSAEIMTWNGAFARALGLVYVLLGITLIRFAGSGAAAPVSPAGQSNRPAAGGTGLDGESADPAHDSLVPFCQAESLDHLVLTVADIQATGAFYRRVLGLRLEEFQRERWALHCGTMKINLHHKGREHQPYAAHPTPGSADLCFLTRTPVMAVARLLEENGIPVEDGPIRRTGATGELLSIYCRDPDGNLVEIANPSVTG